VADTRRVTDHAARVKSAKTDREKALDELDNGDTGTALVFAVLEVAAALHALRDSTTGKPLGVPARRDGSSS